MGKLTTFEIMMDNVGSVKAGDILRGQVLLGISDDILVNEVRVSFMGHTHVQWVEAQRTAPIAEVQTSVVDPVAAEEVYCSDVRKLFPARQTGTCYRRMPKTQTMAKGTYTYHFEFSVPANAPSSFGGNHGYVRYVLKAVVERPWKVDVNKRTVTVESDLDLNNVREAKDSVQLSDDMKFTNFFFSSGECVASLQLARKGFVQGDAIPVEFSIHNNSTQGIHKATLYLKMMTTYKAKQQKCMTELLLGKSALGKVPAGRTLEGLDRKLRVPLTCPPSGLPGCGIISVSYHVELKIKPAILSVKRLKLRTNVIVGTHPLDLTTFDSPPDYWSCCLPPSYEDVMAQRPQQQQRQQQQQQQRAQRPPALTRSATNLSRQMSSPELSQTDLPTTATEPASKAVVVTNDQPRYTILRTTSGANIADCEDALGRPRANSIDAKAAPNRLPGS